MDHKAKIAECVKVVRKHAATVKTNLQIVSETREILPKKQAELEEARAKADIRNDVELRRLSALHADVEMIKGLVDRHPDQLDPDNCKLGEAIGALNDALEEASAHERDVLIQEVTLLLTPYFGTEGIGGAGTTVNPAMDAASEMTLLHHLPRKVRHSFGNSDSLSATSEGRAQSLIEGSEKSLAVADRYLKAGRFITEKLS